MTAKVFEAALGIAAPWSVASVDFGEGARLLTVLIDFTPGSRFAVSGHEGLHPVHDTVNKTYRHLSFFQQECHLQVRTPRVKLPNGSVRLVEPDFAGRLSGFTLLFEAMILMLAQQMPFAAVARIAGESAYRVMAVCERYVEIALGLADFSDVRALAIDETLRARGHDYVTLAADALKRRVLFVTEGRDAKTIEQLAAHLDNHGCPPARQAGSRLFHAAAARWIPSRGLDVVPQGTAGTAQTVLNAHRLTHGATAAAGRRISTTTSVTTVRGTTKPSMTPESTCSASCCCAARIR